MSNIMKAFSGFTGSSPITYYHRISGQYFTPVTSPSPFVRRIFQDSEIANSNEMKVISDTQNPNFSLISRSTYHPTLFVTPNSKRYSSSSDNNLSTSRLLLILLLITAVGISQNEVYAAERPIDLDQQLEMVSLLLEQNPDRRTSEQKITLFNALLSLGIAEADKAKGKNVVLVFGNTGAGKSTLINTIYGCKMAKDEYGGIIVGPKSLQKEIAPIGIGAHSCTFIPKEIPDISFTVADAQPKEVSIKCFDMPGLSDDRGIEVTLANTVIMQRIIENAQSVRFVMVFEEALLTAERGSAWKTAVKLLSERFNGNIGNGEKSLCLVITKGRNDIPTIQKMVKKYTPDGYFDLSDYVMTYNPLNTGDRGKLLNRLYQTKSYRNLGINIALGGEQLWDALKLGDQIQHEIRTDLAEANGVGIDKAVNKIRFTHGIKKFKNTDLAKPHESAEKAVHEYAKKLVEAVKPSEKPNIENQIVAYRKYQSFKGRFDPFVSFEDFDKSVRDIKLSSKDPRDIAWDKPKAGLVSAAITAGAIGVAILTAPVTVPTTFAAAVATAPIALGAAVAATIFGGTTTYSLKHWIWPSQREKDLSEFLEK